MVLAELGHDVICDVLLKLEPLLVLAFSGTARCSVGISVQLHHQKLRLHEVSTDFDTATINT